MLSPHLLHSTMHHQSWHQKGHHLNKDVNQFQHHHQFVMKSSQQRQKQINPKLQTVSKCDIPQVEIFWKAMIKL